MSYSSPSIHAFKTGARVAGAFALRAARYGAGYRERPKDACGKRGIAWIASEHGKNYVRERRCVHHMVYISTYVAQSKHTTTPHLVTPIRVIRRLLQTYVLELRKSHVSAKGAIGSASDSMQDSAIKCY